MGKRLHDDLLIQLCALGHARQHDLRGMHHEGSSKVGKSWKYMEICIYIYTIYLYIYVYIYGNMLKSIWQKDTKESLSDIRPQSTTLVSFHLWGFGSEGCNVSRKITPLETLPQRPNISIPVHWTVSVLGKHAKLLCCIRNLSPKHASHFCPCPKSLTCFRRHPVQLQAKAILKEPIEGNEPRANLLGSLGSRQPDVQ
jgi:hypothetical protein